MADIEKDDMALAVSALIFLYVGHILTMAIGG